MTSDMYLNTDKDQQTQCDTYANLEPSKVEQSQQEQKPNLTRRTSLQLAEAERIIIVEIDKCFRNWYEPWKRTYLDDGPEFGAIYDLMEGLLHYQDQILCNEAMLPIDRSNTIAKAVARLIDYGNAILNIDITLRANDGTFREVDPLSMTTIELYQAHIKAHRLRDKLLQNYFKTATKRQSGDSECPSGTPQQQSTLRVPTIVSSNFPSPVLERSQRFSGGSLSSINTIVPNGSTGSDGRRTPQALKSSLIEVKTMSSTEDLSESQLELRHLIATLKSGAFKDPKPNSIRMTLLEATLAKIESLLCLPNTAEKLTDCFELLDALLNSIENLSPEFRRNEVQMIAISLLETLVRKVYVDDRDSYVEFQRSHWSTYLISLIRMMSDSDFRTYLKKFSNLPDLSAFLRDYLFIIKRLITRPNELDPLAEQIDPIYPECWIEMTLLVCSTLLKSLIYLYQVLRAAYPSNVPIWLSYIDCLIHFILQDTLKPDRIMLKQRQILLADDLRKTSADYVWITWDSLSTNQKCEISEDIIEPLLRVCMSLRSRQRAILLPIFYDMMHCDYTSRYSSPRSTICGSESICSPTTLDQIGNRVQYVYEADLETQMLRSPLRKNTSNSNDSGGSSSSNSNHLLITANQEHHEMPRISSDESLPYLSSRDTSQQQKQHSISRQTSGAGDDGVALSKFTNLIIGKLYNLMVESNLGDEEFKLELCSAIAGDQREQNQASFPLIRPTSEATQFKSMAKQTANLVSSFIQIGLDSRLANKLSYNHLHLLCLFKLLVFFRDRVDRVELYLANLHKLWRLHHNAGRFVEAGFVLLEHAKSLPWSNKPLESNYRIITRSFQTSQQLCNLMDLKLFLYTTIIEYFDQGQLWEAAVPLCRELIDVYQFRLFDYQKLAQILAKLSTFFSNISSGNQRSHPEYFRVTFYGIGFPDCLRNTTMVYRGKPYERLGDFQATLLSKYPDAKLLRTLDQPDESLLGEPEAKYLQINACTPIVDLRSKFPTAATTSSQVAAGMVDVNELPEFILTYYKHNECDKFEFSRRMGCSGGGGGDDFANMWRQRITLTTNRFPGMLPFYSVHFQETTIISPIECAIEDLERANDRLSSMVNRFKADKRREEDARALGQLLLGIVDAAVNGGITKYEEAFFNGSEASATNAPSAARRSGTKNSILPTTPKDRARAPLIPSSPLSGPATLQASLEQHTYDTLSSSSSGLHLTPQLAGSPDICQRLPTASTRNGPYASPSADQMERLKRLIAGQVPLLDEAIRLHSERVADVMRPQHEHLEASYKRLKHHIMSKYSRYLPANYNRNSSFSYPSGTLHAYRSLARSPNRSIRSDSRISTALRTSSPTTNGLGERYNSKRMSDVGRSGTGAASAAAVKLDCRGPDESSASNSGSRDHSVNSATNIPYQKLNNERRSLPFLSGLASIKQKDNSTPTPASCSAQAGQKSTNNHRSNADWRDHQTTAPEKTVPPAPPPRANQYATADEFYASTYVPLAEVKRPAPPPPPPPRLKASTPGQLDEAPNARLLQSDDDDDIEQTRGDETRAADERRQSSGDEIVTL